MIFAWEFRKILQNQQNEYRINEKIPMPPKAQLNCHPDCNRL